MSQHRYSAILSFLGQSDWVIQPSKFKTIMGVMQRRVARMGIDAAVLAAVAAENREAGQPAMMRSVAVLPVFGTIAQRIGIMEDASGGVSTERIGREFDRLMADDTVGAVILNMDSPGGTVYGVPELADRIFAARGIKPTLAIANSFMASGGYWIGAACDQISITPSGELGSIGVLCVHVDTTAAVEASGLKYSVVTHGQYKAEFSDLSPLSDESRAELQRRADLIGDKFTRALAKYRGVSPKVVQDKFGQGRTFFAQEAVERGMADRIETLDEAVSRLAGNKKPKAKRSASIERQRLALSL